MEQFDLMTQRTAVVLAAALMCPAAAGAQTPSATAYFEFLRGRHLESQGQITLDPSGGAVYLYVTGSVIWRGGTVGDTTRFLFGYLGTGTLNLETSFTGSDLDERLMVTSGVSYPPGQVIPPPDPRARRTIEMGAGDDVVELWDFVSGSLVGGAGLSRVGMIYGETAFLG